MLRQSLIFLAVALEGLPLTLDYSARHCLLASRVGTEDPLHHEHVGAVAQQSAFRQRCHWAREAQEVDGLEKVAFPHAVCPQEAVDAGGELQRGFRYVLEVDYVERVEGHIVFFALSGLSDFLSERQVAGVAESRHDI